MKVIAAIVVIAIIVGSFYADYRWRKWMAERRGERR
jgi:hypothetical protein